MTMVLSLLSVGIGAFALFIIYMCATVHEPEISFFQFVKKTFLPMSVHEFLLPPCPLCWMARAAVLAFVAGSFIHG